MAWFKTSQRSLAYCHCPNHWSRAQAGLSTPLSFPHNLLCHVCSSRTFLHWNMHDYEWLEKMMRLDATLLTNFITQENGSISVERAKNGRISAKLKIAHVKLVKQNRCIRAFMTAFWCQRGSLSHVSRLLYYDSLLFTRRAGSMASTAST